MSTKEAYARKIQAQLDEWNARIDQLKARADNADADARIEYHEQIEELRSLRKEMQGKLAELRQAGDDSREDLKAGMESARDALGSALKAAGSRFK